MKKLYLITVILFPAIACIQSQTLTWQTLPNAPIAQPRFQDGYFINSTTGWIIEYFGDGYKTIDGGLNWIQIADFPLSQSALRSIGFFNSNNGIIGTLDSLHVLYRTSNGGTNWTQVNNISGQSPKGICGISIVNENIAYACGRYSCPANVIKTTNNGLEWISLPIDTSLVSSLVDCYFYSADSGFAAGGYSPTNQYQSGRSVIIMTTNGGINWTRVYVSSRTNEWCWKISFISKEIGFVSIETFSGLAYYLKTTDGGLKWIERPFRVYDVQGIGFVNENTGWIGGTTGDTYETTNGGMNWHLAGWGFHVNRFRFLNDTLAYSFGRTVYKYSRQTVGINNISNEIPSSFSLYQNYPNPFNPVTKIKFDITRDVRGETQDVRLIIYDALGKEVVTLVNENLSPGSYEVEFDGSYLSSGIYFYELEAYDFVETKRMILIK